MKKDFPNIVLVAQMCHEANKAWCELNGDDSQNSWEDAEQWQRDSAVAGVQFRVDNPNAGKDSQHNAWMKDKVDSGWVYGEVKDAEKKTHPCLVPFDQLPKHQQMKDALFCLVVDTMLRKYDFESRMARGLTFGESAVGLTFNHATGDLHDKVRDSKLLFAKAIDAIGDPIKDDMRRSWTFNVLRTAAISACISAQMSVVKFLTWKD